MKSAQRLLISIVILLVSVKSFPSSGLAQETAQPIAGNPIRPVFDEEFNHWPEQTKIRGRILINRGLQDLSQAELLLKRFAGDGKKVVAFADEADAVRKQLKKLCAEEDFSDEQSDTARLKLALADADVVYISGTGFTSPQLLDFRDEFRQFIQNAGTLIVDSACAEIFGSATDDTNPAGLNLLLDCCIDCDFDGSEKSRQRLADFAAENSRTVGVGIEADTMLILSGRTMLTIGTGSVTLIVPASETQPEIVQRLTARRSRGSRGSNLNGSVSRADLTQWRRLAIDRTLEPFPPAKPKTPLIENGTLYIVGGGGTPRGLMTEMIEKAGGIENARLVYIPCSESDDVGERQRTVQQWKRMGVKHATFLHTKDRFKANSDDEFLKPLEDATMLWFGGGRQWNFADSYYGTKAHRMMKEVLHRGGVIGGSSAGASIQGRFLARATPIGNTNILAPGYQRGGLGFLSGVAIDQHFSQRGRQKDMTRLVQKYPQLLGIGIDESTAIRVEKSVATVIGNGKVFFYDANQASSDADDDDENEKDYMATAAGGAYDLSRRELVAPDRPLKSD